MRYSRFGMANSIAQVIADQTVVMRVSRSRHTPTLVVLDLVMQIGERQRIDFGKLCDSPQPSHC